MRRRNAALLAATVLCAGCASSGGTVPTTAPPPTTSATTVTTAPPPPSSTTSTPTTTTLPPEIPALARAVLMVGIAGWGIDEGTAAHLAAGGLSLLLLDDNIGSAAQLRSLTREAACAASGPLLIAVDQELGPVARLDGLVTPLPTIAEALQMTPLELEITGQLLGDEMLALGVNVDLAPVLDVVSGANPALEDRSLGDDPDVVAEWGLAFMRGLQQAGVIAVPKHFPGHGRTTTDPHYETARITASREELAAMDFPPFAAAFDAGARAVLIGHPIYDALDADTPASLSPAVLTLLREDFGFDGVAMTDALNMEGVAAGRDPGRLAVQALAAGEDLVLVVDPEEVEPTVAAIVAALATGDLSRARLEEAAARVRALAGAAAPIRCTG